MSRPKKNDFSKKTINLIERRAGFKCSNPDCNAPTSGASKIVDGIQNIGEAAHIICAGDKGPRADSRFSSEYISSPENGIWLCSNCHKKIDTMKNVSLYSPELLRKWKKKREEEAEKAVGVPEKPLRDVIAEISNTYQNMSENSTSLFNNDIDYKNINFPSLGNYLINFINDKKQPKVEELNDLCMEKVLDWFVGNRTFPKKEINELYKTYDNSILKIDNNILYVRRDALIKYFTGNLVGAKNNYDSYLDFVINNKTMFEWYKNDYLIDGRNLTVYANPINRYSENNKYQKIMDDKEIFVTYPSIDRLEKTLLNKTLDSAFTMRYKRRGAQIFGFGAEQVFINIQKIIYISIIYGSITQLNVIRNVFGRVCIEFANTLEYDNLYLKSLKFYALNGNYKEYKNISSNMSQKIKEINSKKFINEILKVRKSIIPYNKDEFDIFVFNQLGRLLDDDIFIKYQNRVFKILKRKRKNLVIDAIKSLYSNVERITNKYELFEILLKLAKNGYSRDVQNVLAYVNYKSLSSTDKVKIKEIISIIISSKEYLYISGLLIEIKKIENTNEYDDILLQEGSVGNELYEIEKNKEHPIDNLEMIIKNLENKYNDIFKTGIVSRNIIPYDFSSKDFDVKDSKIDEIIIDRILPLSQNSLSHKRIEYREKIKMLKVLLYIHFYDSKYDIFIKDILSKILVSSDSGWPIEEYNEKYINIYTNALKFVLDELSLNNLLKKYILIGDNEYFIEDISFVISYLSSKIKIKDECLFLVSILIEKSLTSDKSESVCSAVKLSKVLYNTKYFNNIYNKLITASQNCSFEVASAFITLLLNLNDIKLHPIKENLLNNLNFNIKSMTKTYLADL